MNLGYDPETKRQSEKWHTKNSTRPKKARMNKSKVKTIIFRQLCKEFL